jgi:hypothetical protein
MSGVLIAAALALVALCAAAIGAGRRRRRRWRTTGSGGGRGGAAGGDATGGSESGVGERGNNRRTCLISLFCARRSRSRFSLLLGEWPSNFKAKRSLFLLRSWLPHSPFGRAFSRASHGLCDNKCLEFSNNHAESSFAWGSWERPIE